MDVFQRYTGSNSVFFTLLRQDTSKFWNDTTKAEETYNAANIEDYAITTSSVALNLIKGTIPTEISDGTVWLLSFYARQGSTPATTDEDYPVGDARLIKIGESVETMVEGGTLTNRQMVELLIDDQSNLLFSDNEIDSVLDFHDDDVFMACSSLCMAMATSRAKIALMITTGTYTKDARSIARELARRAEEFRTMAGQDPAIYISPGNDGGLAFTSIPL